MSSSPGTDDARSAEPVFELTASPHFPAWLAAQRSSLVFTTYQTAKVFLIGLQPNGRIQSDEIRRYISFRPQGLPGPETPAAGEASRRGEDRKDMDGTANPEGGTT